MTQDLTANILTVSPERQADANETWSKELRIFEKRATGDRSYYPSLANPGYMAWPAPARPPYSYQQLSRQVGDAQIMESEEKVAVTKKGISFDGDTALAFFETHRTQRAGGEPVDERYENIHVWVKRKGEWRLISNMSRAFVDGRERLGDLVINQTRD